VAKRVCTALNSWIKLRGQEPGPLFCKISRAGTLAYTALTKEGLSSILDEMRRYAEVAKFTPHDLRRTFITQLLDSGVDINVVRQLAGHSEISTTARYDCRGEGTKISASRSFSCW
jgi:integrase